ncbi:MAG: glycosyltransferase family protein [Bacteroidota bacterium]|nr:glycosyltransferase family protein [Bacteroidota bacterium]
MLSIIICHRSGSLLKAMKESIELTIGIPYELIVIDNTLSEHTIFSAYNEGVRKAQYDIVCFAHEDILFYTNDWGKNVVAHFKDAEAGMIGVAGGLAQSVVPSAWWYNNYFAKSARNILMRSGRKKDKKLYHYYSNPYNDGKTEAVIIDGLWFCIRKSLFDKIEFDEKTFAGFHLYDADISMQVQQHARIYVVYDVLIEHLWNFSISEDYYMALCSFANKWRPHFPAQANNVEKEFMNYYNWHVLRNVVLEMRTKKINHPFIQSIIKKYFPIAKENFDSKWFRSYFFISRFIGYENANRIFYRLEKIAGFNKPNSQVITEYKGA